METILFFQPTATLGARLRLEGLSTFAKEINWNVQCCEEAVDARSLVTFKEFWRPVGMILSTDDERIKTDVSIFSPHDTVLLDCFPRRGLERFATVTTDSATVTELAARELLGSPCAAYGFVPWFNRCVWSENRRHHFSRFLLQQGRRLHEFTPSVDGLSVNAIQRELIPWLRALPKPCGIFAANDCMAENVLQACHLAKLIVPFDCLVVGTDDNTSLCEHTTPTLSSVGLDFKTSGYRAGELLNELVHGRLAHRPLINIPPLGFTRRNSSRVFLRTDRAALQASELIRAKACEGLAARDVLSIFPCSRRLAEIRFRKATGHTVIDEIQSVRIEHAKHLLNNPFQRLDTVAEQCGYESDTTFRRFFKQKTGLTLRQWQKRAHI